MSREYTVALWTPWIDRDTDELVRDNHGNFKGSVHFDEDERQADATFKTQPEKGDKKYGDLVEYETRSGNKRLKFQRTDRPLDGQTSLTPANDHKGEYWDDKNAQIRAQWAIGQALKWLKISDVSKEPNYDNVETLAKEVFAMVDRVKGVSESTDPKDSQQSSNHGKLPDSKTLEMRPTTTNGNSGYEKAKAQHQTLKARTPEQQDKDEDKELSAALRATIDNDEPIDLKDIPF
jgi:hypothetical protein